MRYEAIVAAGNRSCATLLVCTILSSGGVLAAELGDFDGDGRLSLADVSLFLDGIEPAVGSIEGALPYGCSTSIAGELPGFVYLESLRRSLQPAPPLWVRFWPQDIVQEPLAPDPRILVRVENVSVLAGADTFLLETVVTTLVALRAFSIVVESEADIIRPPFVFSTVLPRERWDQFDWTLSARILGNAQEYTDGDVPVAVTPHSFLVTGRYVLTYGVRSTVPQILPPSEYRVVTEVRLPRGLAPGVYPLEVHPASEFVLDDGSPVAPVLAGDAELSVAEAVATGWDEGLPRISIEGGTNSVSGKVEFRVTDEGGRSPAQGEPVLEAAPGEELSLLVQMKTEIPLNEVLLKLAIGRGLLCSTPVPEVVFTSPEDGLGYLPVGRSTLLCFEGLPGEARAQFFLGGADGGGARADVNTYPFRPLEHFKPLGEWTDMLLLRLRVAEQMGDGDEIRLDFRDDSTRVQFVPYGTSWPHCSEPQPEDPHWSYEVVFHDSFVRVSSDHPGQCPTGGLRFELGNARGNPGDLVEIPVFARGDEEFSRLFLVLEGDQSTAVVEAFTVNVVQGITGELVRERVNRGSRKSFFECLDLDGDGVPDECEPGVPFIVDFKESSAGVSLVELTTNSSTYPPDTLLEIGRLMVRIAESPPRGDFRLVPAQAEVTIDGVITRFESGATPYPDTTDVSFFCASDFQGGVIAVEGIQFLRGDVNADGKADISDAVRTLGYLFLEGGSVQCLTAADSNDDDSIDLSDPIQLLNHLYLGAAPIAPPYPACGEDLTPGPLNCFESGCFAGREP